jgi:curved DNA-binding protein CbpA
VEENQLYMEIVELGFREAIKKYHPDRGGDPEKAACVNALRDKIHLIAGVKK